MATDFDFDFDFWEIARHTSEQAVASLVSHHHMHREDLVQAAIIGLWKLGPEKIHNPRLRYMTAKRRAIDEFRKLCGDKRNKTEHPTITSIDYDERQECYSYIGVSDDYPSECESVETLISDMTNDHREVAIFTVIANGGTKREAAKAIGRDPSRVSQILSMYRNRIEA
jgi:DNA-directed RNA polymerase specialized sigma24 family protein